MKIRIVNLFGSSKIMISKTAALLTKDHFRLKKLKIIKRPYLRPERGRLPVHFFGPERHAGLSERGGSCHGQIVVFGLQSDGFDQLRGRLGIPLLFQQKHACNNHRKTLLINNNCDPIAFF